jgi:signal transduction histidine kinase
VLFLLLTTPALLFISILVFGFALFFAYIRVKPINNRIQRVADAARVWSSGNLVMQIRDDQKDELGILSDQLNQVATSLRVTTEKLEKEKRQVEQLLRAKREWMANVSHELRTPIAILRGHLDLWDNSKKQQRKRSVFICSSKS